jgi:hypothetical protein
VPDTGARAPSPARATREPVAHPAMDRATDTPQAAMDAPKGDDRGASAASGSAPSPEAVWPRVPELAGPRLRAMLEMMSVQQASAKLLRLGVPASRSAMARDHLPDIVRLVQETGARSMSSQLVDIKEAAPASADTGAPAGDAPSRAAVSREDADEHPLVKEAARLFGAKVTHIHPKRR